MNDIFTKEQVLNAYNNAPDFMRSTFNDEKTTQIVMGLQAKFQLHIDMAGILAKEVGYLLLGLVDPSKFAGRLKNSGFSEQVSTEIVAEINQKIFVPLREQMRSGAGNTQPTQSAEPIKPIPTRNEPSFTNPTPANPRFPRPAVVPSMSMSPHTQQMNASMPRYSNLENKTVPLRHAEAVSEGGPRPASNPSNSPSGLADALKQVLHEEKQAPINPNEKLLEDHEEPHIEIDKTSVPPHLPGVIQPGARFSPIAHEVKSSPIIPKTEPLAHSIPSEPPKPIPPITPPVASVPPAPHPAPSRPYSTDPYREPIDTP